MIGNLVILALGLAIAFGIAYVGSEPKRERGGRDQRFYRPSRDAWRVW